MLNLTGERLTIHRTIQQHGGHHAYGTTTLFAALNVADGKLIGTCMKRHPRFHMHFIPTNSSWLNLVKRWFREITDKRIRRGVFKSVPQLIQAIEAYIAAHNQNPKSFVWTAKAQDILDKVRRTRGVLDKKATS